MAGGVEIEGIDSLIEEIADMGISNSAIKETLGKIGETVSQQLKDNPKTPKVSGKTKESINYKVGRKQGALAVTVSVGVNYSGDTDWGTSKNRKYTGWFENGTEDSMDKVMNICNDLVDKNKGL